MSRRRISRCRPRHPQVVESNLSWPDSTWPLTSCTHGWIYNFSLYYPTITSQVSYYQLMWIPLASDEPPVVLLFVLLSCCPSSALDSLSLWLFCCFWVCFARVSPWLQLCGYFVVLCWSDCAFWWFICVIRVYLFGMTSGDSFVIVKIIWLK